MIRDTSEPRTKKPGKQLSGHVRFVGLVKAAAKVGVHRVHLHMVLRGKRESASLLAKIKTFPVKNKPGYTKVEAL